MGMRKLRVYTGPELGQDLETTTRAPFREAPRADTVTLALGDVLPLLADAVASNRTWLTDFADDEITITADLHDVLQAYRHFRRPGA